MIRVIYTDKSTGEVEAERLEELIISGRVAAFCRSSGWVDLTCDPVRGQGGLYAGPERRKRRPNSRAA